MHPSVHCSAIYNCRDMEATKHPVRLRGLTGGPQDLVCRWQWRSEVLSSGSNISFTSLLLLLLLLSRFSCVRLCEME